MAKKNVSSPKRPIKKNRETFFPIVGIGASAGGLEAIEKFFFSMPSDSNIAFVVIQHLSPHHKSIMSSLLKKDTKMEINVIEDGMKVELNCVYLNPPNKNVSILNRSFQLMDITEPHIVNLPIDIFFRSLSNDLGEKAICVILSGTGTDGTLGLKAIKGVGGMTMVQEEQQAMYTGMPRSAIDTGLVDFVLPVEKMPEQILRYVQHPYIDAPEKVGVNETQFQNNLQKIFILIRSATGHDFSNYKQNTIRRRIERRLAVHQISNIADYVRYVQKNPAELETLFKDLLITVTNFFRDPESFDVLQKKVIPNLIQNVEPDSALRVWVPGCATGEEAYSIAILMKETMEKLKRQMKIQIFATDIDEEAIKFARVAIYPDAIAADISDERLKRFFLKEKNAFKVKEQIREMVIFANHNLIKDPPFSKLHMVSCRNLMIYMDQVLQKKIIPLFHYALNQDGILFLGTSESIGGFSELFLPVDKKWKIYIRKGISVEGMNQYHRAPFYVAPVEVRKADRRKIPHDIDIHKIADKLIIEEYSPPSVLINEKFEILYFTGDTDKYLTLPIGEASFNILKLARKEFQYKLGTALREAANHNKDIILQNLRIKHNSKYHVVDIIIRSITEIKKEQNLWLIVFKDKAQPEESAKTKKIVTDKAENHRIIALEQELLSTKEYLQTTVEELETFNEELKSANEELQSTNEELQSTNEELETSQEELQSTNEELITVNSELRNKNAELSHANNDIYNLLASIEIATVFLDNELRIKRFTPEITKIYNLVQLDVGRPIGDITQNIKYGNILDDAKEVLDTLETKEIEIQNNEGQFYSMRIAPYRTTDNVIDGVVITFVDISEVKEAKRLAAVVKDSNDAITLQDLDGNITAWNRGAEKMYGYSESEALKMNISEIIPEEKSEEAQAMRKKMLTENVDSFKTWRLTKDGRIMDVWLTVTLLSDSAGKPSVVATTEREISVIKKVHKVSHKSKNK